MRAIAICEGVKIMLVLRCSFRVMRQSAIVLLLACGLAACSASLADCSTGDARIVIAQWGNVVGRDADSNIKLTGGRAIFKV